jgi:hypothetical protein
MPWDNEAVVSCKVAGPSRRSGTEGVFQKPTFSLQLRKPTGMTGYPRQTRYKSCFNRSCFIS